MRQIVPVSVLEDERRALHKARPDYAKLAGSSLVLGTWDDHDYGGNDMGKDMGQKDERRDAFWKFLGPASWKPENRHGVFHSITFGEVPRQITLIVLDARTYREDCSGIASLSIRIRLGAGIACVTRWLAAGLGS